MGTRIEKNSDMMSTRLRYIENRTRELERLLADRVFEEPEDRPSDLTRLDVDDGRRAESAADDGYPSQADYPDYTDEPDGTSQFARVPGTEPHTRTARTDPRTEQLIQHGRVSRRSRLLGKRNIVIAVAVGCVLLVIAMLTIFGGGASWPASVATVRTQILRACQNPDVVSEPGQVNFACAKSTQQVLWVFSLLTSKDDPAFTSAKTGREGLEPITASQGGQIAWSLNLHQPYNPLNPVDSLEVAARAINNIVGGATVTGSNGKTVVEAGLESNPSNCARYTGSPAVVSRAGYPSLCALPVSSAAGQAALVSDIYQQWVVGASQVAAQAAGVLFENSNDPGNAQVQAILNNPPDSGL